MANSKEFSRLLARMLRARIPFIAIQSLERARVLEILRKSTASIGIPAFVHSLSKGTCELSKGNVVQDDRSAIGGLEYATAQIAARENLTYIFTEVDGLADDTPVCRRFYDATLLAVEKSGSLIVITNQGIWPQLQRLGMTLTLDSPDEDEMLTIVKRVVDDYKSSMKIEWDEADIRQASTTLANLTQVEAENILMTLIAGGGLSKADLVEVVKAKDRLFGEISGLEKVPIDPGMTAVAGLGGLQAWLEKNHRLTSMDLRDRKIRPPRGVLLVGVPGCGKSLSAKHIASTWKLPLYRLDLASIHGQYLGQSENRLKEALSSADHAAPCILWIDEIEKGLAGAGNGGDGGTSTRMVGQFLFWLQESCARVFVVATANDVSRLPPELLRRGRFDELFFVDLPGPEERLDIIRLYIKRNKVLSPGETALAELVVLSDGFAGADLESAVREVAIQAVLHGDSCVDETLFKRSFESIVPLSKTSPEQIESIRLWGKDRAVPASGNAIVVGNHPAPRRSVII